jgi:hypothetical protein
MTGNKALFAHTIFFLILSISTVASAQEPEGLHPFVSDESDPGQVGTNNVPGLFVRLRPPLIKNNVSGLNGTYLRSKAFFSGMRKADSNDKV